MKKEEEIISLLKVLNRKFEKVLEATFRQSCNHQNKKETKTEYDKDYKKGYGGVRRFYKCKDCGTKLESYYPRIN